jgi:hypothetical protein
MIQLAKHKFPQQDLKQVQEKIFVRHASGKSVMPSVNSNNSTTFSSYRIIIGVLTQNSRKFIASPNVLKSSLDTQVLSSFSSPL